MAKNNEGQGDRPVKVAALIEADEAAGPVTDNDARRAQAEADEAAALVDALEKRVVDGDEDITPDEIANAESLGRFARLRAQATARKAERAKRAARLKACDALRAEMVTYAENAGHQFADLLKAAEESLNAFVVAVDERNGKIRGWHKRMLELRVPRHNNPVIPPAEHAHLGYGEHNGELIAGARRMAHTDADPYVARMLALVRAANHQRGRFTFDMAKIHTAGDPYADLASIDAPLADPDPNLRFFLTVGGSVLSMDREPNEHEAAGIVREIPRKEAWGA